MPAWRCECVLRCWRGWDDEPAMSSPGRAVSTAGKPAIFCPLCGASAGGVGKQRVLGKYDVSYFRCAACDLLFTEQPYWLAEAYDHAISQLDTGAIARNELCASLTALVAASLGVKADARCLDFGGGHGVFVRMMRDRGLDFHWYDTHAENLYARGFEGEPSSAHALTTAFEVVEHFADARRDWEQLLGGRPEAVLIGTVLHDGHQPGWWYYLLESGQHVAFYSARTMAFIAERFGYEVEAGPEYTLFLRRDVLPGPARRSIVRRMIARPAIALQLSSLFPAALLGRLLPYRSRLVSDYEQLRDKLRS